MPSRTPLDSLFGRSPIGPIQDHMVAANEAAQLLPDLFRACAASDWDEVRRVQGRIAEAEQAADDLKRSVRRNLSKSLFLPVPRSDLLMLVSIQDHVANTSKDIAGLVVGRSIRFPDQLHDLVLALAQAGAATARQALKAIQELDELLEVGFSGRREVQRVEDMLKELDDMEAATDELAVQLRARLFRIERELPPVDVVFYYRIISLLAQVGDDAESVGDRLLILLAN